MGTATIRSILSVAAVIAMMFAAPQPASAQSTGWLTRATSAVREQFNTERPRVFRRSIELEDASLETLKTRLGWLGIELPLELTGDVTTRLGVEVDLSSLRDAKSYRIHGALSSKRLIVEGLELRNLTANVRYVDGTLSLDQLVATVPDPRPAGRPGRAVGEATLQLLPVGAFMATLRLDGVPLEPFHRRIDAARSLVGGRVTGQVVVEAPVSNLRDAKAWRGTGSVTLVDLRASDRSIERLVAHAELAEGVLNVAEVAATIEGERANGSATLNLVAPFAYRIKAAVPEGELSRVDELFGTTLPQRWLGRYELTANATGTLRPFTTNAGGSLRGTDWTVAGVPIESFRAALTSDGSTVTLSELDAQVYDGRVAGRGMLKLNEGRTFSFELHPERLDLAALDPIVDVAMRDERGQRVTVGYRAMQADASDREPADQPSPRNDRTGEGIVPRSPVSPDPPSPDPPRLDGTATGDVEVTGQTLPFRLDALEGSLVFDDLTIAGVTFDRAEIVADTENRTLVLSRLSLVKGDGRLSGEGRIALDPPGAFAMTVRPERFAIDEAQPFFGAGVAELDLPPISGMLDGELTAAGESQPFRLETLTARLAGDNIRIGRLIVDRFEMAAATADETIDVSKLLVVIEDGRLTGRASLGLDGERPFEATLRPDRFRIELLKPLFGEGGLIETDFPPVSGRVSGEMTLRGRAEPEELDEVSGRLDAENATVSGVQFDRAGFAVATEQGVAWFRDLHAQGDFGTLRGTGTLDLSAPYDYVADLTFDDVDLSGLGRITAVLTEEQRPDVESPADVAEGSGVLPIDLEGLADVKGNLRGTLLPFVLTGEGAAASDRLLLDARDLSDLFRPATLEEPRFAWRYSERRLTLDEIRAGFGKGTFTGTAAVPLGDAAAGMLDLRMTNVEISDLLNLPGDVGGVATGELTAELGFADEDGERPLAGRATLSIPNVRVSRFVAGDVAALVSLERDLIGYDVSGRLFDGTLSAEGTWPLDAGRQDVATGNLRWTGVNLARMAAVSGNEVSVSGVLDLSGQYDLAGDGTKGTGVVEVSNLRSRDRLVTERLQARVVWADSTIRVENAVGGFAGGTVAFTAILDAQNPSRGRIEIALRRADAQRAVGWIPGLEPIEGTLEGRLRGNLGQLWRWQGEAEISRGSYGPLAFSSWRIPVDIDANPRRAAIRVELRRTAIRAARGRAMLSLIYVAGASNRFELNAEFDGLEASRIVETDSLSGRVAGSRVSGTVELSSRNLQSIADLEGTVVASLSGSQVQNLPVIGSVVDVAKLPTGGGGTIERGDVRVSVRRGVARVEEVMLAGPSFRLFAEGTVALASGRLALDVVADTSPARVDRAIAGYLLRQFIDYGTPIGWIERANRFIAERAIYLRVTGTYRRPVVRVRPIEQLGQEAVRFFLNELAAPVGGSPATPRL